MDIDAIKANIQKYLHSNSQLPFYVCVDKGEEYADIISCFPTLTKIRSSNYCKSDSLPDIDKLYDELLRIDKDSMLLGAGSVDRLSNGHSVLGRIRSLNLPHKLVVLCRGAYSKIEEIAASDSKFIKTRYCKSESTYDCKVIKISPDLKFENAIDIKTAISKLEDGYTGNIYVATNANISSDDMVNEAYTALKMVFNGFHVSKEKLDDTMWNEFLHDSKLEGMPLDSWRTYLKYLIKLPENLYLKEVVKNSTNYKDYRNNLVSYILTIEYTAPEYRDLYEARKTLLKDYTDIEIVPYITMASIKGNDKIHYLTDNTKTEKREIIREISRTKQIPTDIKLIYPALYEYLSDYAFVGSPIVGISEYFSEYRRNKLMNIVPDTFIEKVIGYAADGKREYNKYPAKNKIIESKDDGKTKLLWIDALGVEYLSYIRSCADRIGLAIKAQIGSSVLPSLTVCNKDFYDSWKGDKYPKVGTLDELKHEGLPSEKDILDSPVYLTEELELIENELIKIKSDIVSGKVHSVLIASDHGASRLAVIYNSENKLEMVEQGKHSGRCCPVSDFEEKPEFACKGMIESENKEYWVLASYERFKGSRAAKVEVHGGASLEEVLVPIITVSLADKTPKLPLKVETETVYYSPAEDPIIEIFVPFKVNKFILRLDNTDYLGEEYLPNKYRITLTDCKKIKRNVIIECYDEYDFIGKFNIEITSKSKKAMSENNDDFFS